MGAAPKKEAHRHGRVSTPPETWVLTRWVFLRLLAFVFLIAFLSLRVQMDGLIGSHGVEPAAQYLASMHRQLGWQRFLQVPSLAWIDSSDVFLHALCDSGAVLSVGLLLGIAEGPTTIALWACYLSFVTIGGFFFNWMCDKLLLETAFFATFLSPLRLRAPRYVPPRLAVFLMQFLLFRFTLECGLGKLLSFDPVWRSLSALHFHLQTQPNPNRLTWYANQLPEWFKQLSTALVLAIEVLAPLLVLARPRWRRWSFVPLVGLQLLIALSGNYAWFNWLTIVLAVFLLDDAIWRRVLPRWARGDSTQESLEALAEHSFVRLWWFAGCLVLIGSVQFADKLRVVPGPIGTVFSWIAPFNSINLYGAFSHIPRERLEIELQGSNDGLTWKPYEFRWKPGRVERAPAVAEPHQPRLDWAMCEVPRRSADRERDRAWHDGSEPPLTHWLSELRGRLYQGSAEVLPPDELPGWFHALVDRLLEGSPDVLALLDGNPYPAGPPRMIRGMLYRYRYTTPEEHSTTRDWWRREPIRVYFRPIERRYGKTNTS